MSADPPSQASMQTIAPHTQTHWGPIDLWKLPVWALELLLFALLALCRADFMVQQKARCVISRGTFQSSRRQHYHHHTHTRIRDVFFSLSALWLSFSLSFTATYTFKKWKVVVNDHLKLHCQDLRRFGKFVVFWWKCVIVITLWEFKSGVLLYLFNRLTQPMRNALEVV